MNIRDLAVMDWYSPTDPLVKQLSALHLDLLEEAIDLHHQRVSEYEEEHLCAGCGAGYEVVDNPAHGSNCPEGQPSTVEELAHSSNCPL